jgi:PleD family two-component response regulator
VTQPLALVLYEKLLPGSQLVNRLQDLNYRVQVVSEPRQLVQTAEQAKPMLVLADLNTHRTEVSAAIKELKSNQSTSHLPVIGFSTETAADLQSAATATGVTLFVSDTALLGHLPQLLDQALSVE